MTTPTPDWDLLPHDPLAFFELSPEFERKDLKRAYTRLIRVFKPETFPAEFQRIRAAYDLLDERLRYMGGTPMAPMQMGLSIRSEPTADSETDSGLDYVALIGEAGIAGARLALRRLDRKTPADWFRLALVEEALESDSLAAVRTLVEAVQATEGSNTSVQYLRAILHEGVAPKDCAVLVQELVALVSGSRRVLPADAYWFLTEPLWVSLVRSANFEQFAELFERCTQQVGEEGRQGRLVALTTLIRRAMFRADPTWLDAVSRELADAYNQLPPWNQADIDLIEWLALYREQREAFRRPVEIRETLDRAIVAIVEGDEVRADRAFLEAQVACLDQRGELFEAFSSRELSGTPVGILLWYADDVAARHGDFYERETEAMEAKHVRDFSFRVLRRTHRNWGFRLRRFLVGLAVIVAFFMSWSLIRLALVQIPFVEEQQWIVFVVVLALYAVALKLGWVARGMRILEQPFMLKIHRSLWREMTMEFLAESHIPLRDVLTVINLSEDKDAELNWYLELVSGDEALYLYSSALRFA